MLKRYGINRDGSLRELEQRKPTRLETVRYRGRVFTLSTGTPVDFSIPRGRGRQGGWVQLIIFLLATIVSIALAPKPPKPRAASLEDFELPTAEEDREIPMIFGEVEVTGPNVIWYGHLDKKKIKKKSLFSSTTIGYKYYLSMHAAICYGPVDEITQIRVDDKLAWEGSITDNDTAAINEPNFFGGKKAEGGIVGGWQFMFGAGDQAPNAYLEGPNALNEPQPAYRGILTALWENSTSDDRGYIGNSRYLKPHSFTVLRRSAGWEDDDTWYPSKIAPSARSMNPAHIIYQCLTDTRWGMGRPSSGIDTAAFEYAADQLFDEGLGVRLLWNQSTSIEDFISNVLDHIDGTFAFNPETGQLVLKLIRGDYDVEDLPVFDENNIASMDSFQRQVWGETVNEVTVVYTDPDTLKKTSVTAHDLANIRSQGQIHETVQLPGLYDHELAQKAVMRELQTRSTPLAKMRFTTNREAWDEVQGDVIVVNWPPLGIEGMVLRVLSARKGALRDGRITVEGIEDLFSLDIPTYTNVDTAQPPETPPATPPDDDESGGSVTSTTQTAPPLNPNETDIYFVPDGATGAWAGHDGEIATWNAETGEWEFEAVADGTVVLDEETGEHVTLSEDGTTGPAPWTPAIPPLPEVEETHPDLDVLRLVVWDTVLEQYFQVQADRVGGAGAGLTQTFLTANDETGTLANSRQIVAGSGITINTATPGTFIISAIGGQHYKLPLTNGDPDNPEMLFADGDIVTVTQETF